MIKYCSLIIIIIGIALIGLGGYQYYKTKEAQKNSLAEAHRIIELSKGKPPTELKTGTIEAFNPTHGETIGILSIPKINAELPIVEGTSEDELEKGVGHYKGTAYPTQKDQIVLSGHRDTVFRRMGELKIGDVFIVKLLYGSYEYKIESTKIVDADDRSIIKSSAPEEELVVTTCYPFSYVGDAPDRYIITAKPTKND